MAGTIPLSMTQQFDEFGKPLSGGLLYIIQAGTVSTPQDAFQDVNLTIKMPYPIILDAAGRIPQFFLADGTVKVRLQSQAGLTQLSADQILVIGPSSGGGGGAAVDPNALVQMGNMIIRYGVGVLGGYVRCNGLTIGSATSSATEHAASECQALFNYLWQTDPLLAVPGGRGVSPSADWAANKQLALPDWRGYAVGALDNMGNPSPAGRLTAPYFGLSRPLNDPLPSLSPIVLGAIGGGESLRLAASQIPAVSFSGSGTTATENATHTHNVPSVPAIAGANNNTGGGGGPFAAMSSSTTTLTTGTENQLHAHAFSFSGSTVNGTTLIRTIGPRKLCSIYMKL
jgi:hypothetical protein